MTQIVSIRELATDELDVSAGNVDLQNYVAINRWVSPLDIHAFNPQPDPPAKILIVQGA